MRTLFFFFISSIVTVIVSTMAVSCISDDFTYSSSDILTTPLLLHSSESLEYTFCDEDHNSGW